MSFPTVLGYSHNEVIQKYKKQYLWKILELFQSISLDSDLQKNFLSVDIDIASDFLLHPDIASIIQKYISHPQPKYKNILEKEITRFLSKDFNQLTQNKGKNIPNTDIKLTDIDNNPENTIVNHPWHDQSGMVWWWEREESEWLEVFGKSLSLLRDINSEFYNELNSNIKKVVPMKTAYGVHNSCSYSNCIWTLYLGYTIDIDQPELSILEALIHESSHNKLNLIMQIESLHWNDDVEKYYSPYRPDARPVHGVLLWVHAIVPTVYVMLQAIEQWHITDNRWYEKVVLYHIKNKLWHRVLQKYALLTEIWKQIFWDMWSVIKLCDEKIKSIPELQQLDLQQIQSYAKSHFLEVQKNYPYLQY